MPGTPVPLTIFFLQTSVCDEDAGVFSTDHKKHTLSSVKVHFHRTFKTIVAFYPEAMSKCEIEFKGVAENLQNMGVCRLARLKACKQKH